MEDPGTELLVRLHRRDERPLVAQDQLPELVHGTRRLAEDRLVREVALHVLDAKQ